jgi:catechol 2,3-dioxygenase-like lactoylglutathione lyase family enzyme
VVKNMAKLNQHIERIEFVTLWSKNLEASRSFYIDRLGLSILHERAGEFFQFDIAGMPVCVDYHAERTGTESNQIGVRVSDLEATVALLGAAGFQVKRGQQPESPERWASITDPDGHELIFISDNSGISL